MSHSIELAKQTSTHLKSYVEDNFAIKIQIGHAQQLVSAALGFKSYQSFCKKEDLLLFPAYPYFYPQVIDQELSSDYIYHRIKKINGIDQRLLTVTDELAIESKCGFHPKCENCQSVSEFRWAIPFIDGAQWHCKDCLASKRIDNAIFADRLKLANHERAKYAAGYTRSAEAEATNYMDSEFKQLVKLAKINSLTVWNFTHDRYADTNRSLDARITHYKCKPMTSNQNF